MGRAIHNCYKKIKMLQSGEAPPYHLFKVKDNCFLYDTSACRFYKIDDITYEFLELCLSCDIEEAAHRLKASRKHPEAAIDSVKSEILLLAQNGLFSSPDKQINIDDAQQEMAQYNLRDRISEIQLSLSDGCNLACKYCYCRLIPDRGQNLMSQETAKKSIDFLVAQSSNNVSITMFGGEPLLNKPVIDFIMEYTKTEPITSTGKTVNYIITTNATLLDQKTIDYIVNDNFGLMVSLDGPKELHDAQCPTKSGEGSFDLAARNIKKLMARRTVGVRATMTHPMPDLKNLIRFFMDFGFHNMVIGATTNRKDAPTSYDFDRADMKSFSDQQESILDWTLEYLKRGEHPPYFLFEKWYNMVENNEISLSTKIHNCGAGVGIVSIDAAGNFYPCAKFSGLKNWRIGNLARGVDEEAIRLKWMNFLKAIEPYCGKCWAYAMCGGPCLWECARESGELVFNDIYCNFTKKSIERSVYLSFNSHSSEEN